MLDVTLTIGCMNTLKPHSKRERLYSLSPVCVKLNTHTRGLITTHSEGQLPLSTKMRFATHDFEDHPTSKQLLSPGGLATALVRRRSGLLEAPCRDTPGIHLVQLQVRTTCEVSVLHYLVLEKNRP